MKHSGGRRSRRPMTWAVVVVFGAALLPASAFVSAQASDAVALRAPSSALAASALAKPHAKTKLRGFSKAPATVSLGGTVQDPVVILPRARRTVVVQALQPGAKHFVTQSVGSSSARGTFRAVYRPKGDGVWKFRLVVKPTRTHRGVTSPTRQVTVLDKTAPAAVTGLKVSEVTLSSATLSWVNPADADFTGVMIRRAVGLTAPATPTSGTAMADTGRTVTTFIDRGLTNNTQYSYSLFAHDGSPNFARVASISARTTRTSVRDLVATSVGRHTVNLAWTNPSFSGFSGVTVRRALGLTPPSSPTEGIGVGDVPSSASTFTDATPQAKTTYTYALFAHDAAGNASAPATVTVTTLQDGTIAALSVNPLPSVNTGNRVTTDTAVAFDGSGSLPAVGTNIVSWQINYGDGITDIFTGPPVAPDIINTTHTFTNTGDKTVTLTVKDSHGDSESATVTLRVFAAPKVSLSVTGDTQANVPITFEIKPDLPGGAAVTSYQMVVTGDDNFFVDGFSTPPPTLDVTFASGSYTVVFTLMTDAGGSAVSDPPVLVTVP